MEEKKFAAGNLTFAVRELHTGRGDGISVDILANQDGDVSLIRLDWFPDCPHYHYNPRTEKNLEIPLDPALISDSIGWFLDQLPDRLSSMILSAGHPHVAEAVDSDEVVRVLSAVKDAAAQARQDCGAELNSPV
jgi:hypothetical protein